MAKFSVNILGCGSASPSLRHQPSCQVVNFRDTLFMIDCGEGTQLQMRRMHMKFSRLRHIFITHMHGDHFLGLPGLLSTMSLLEVPGEVHVYMPEEGIRVVKEVLDISLHESSFGIVFHPVEFGTATVYEDDALTVSTFPLYHTAPCVGYLFREKEKLRPLRKDMLDFFEIPISQRVAIKHGADFVTADGRVIANSRLTTDPEPSMSYAYCSDTRFHPAVAEAVRGVDTIYHEATYTDDRADRAAGRGHSTARQAGITARNAGANRLIIGHYSQQYDSDDVALAEAREEFPNTIAANEGMTIDLL